MSTPKILDLHGKPISRADGLNGRQYNNGLQNGAASLDNPSLMGWRWEGGSADDDIVQDLPVVRQRCRDLALNSPIIAGLINTIINSVIGQGLLLEPTPDAELLGMTAEDAAHWKKQVARVWDSFAESKDCSVSGDENFYDLTRLVLRSAIESGDMFVAMPLIPRADAPLDLRVQPIEADCVSNPLAPNYAEMTGDTFGGVEVDAYGKVVAYWVATRHPLAKRQPFFVNGQMPLLREWVRVPAVGDETGRRNMLHVARRQRPGQRRGIPLLAPVVEATKVLDRYMKAELQAALIQTLFTAAIKSAQPADTLGGYDAMASQLMGEDAQTPREKFYAENGGISLGAGTVAFLAPGDEIQPIGVTHPESGFSQFVDAQLKMIGSAVGVPFEMLTLSFQASYSASRAALNMATAGFKVQRDWIAQDFCQPVYEAFLTEAVLAGHIHAPGFFDPFKRRAYCAAKWNGPGALQIDPTKEIDAAIKRCSVGVSTLQQETSEINGGDWMVNAAARHAEQQVFDKAGWDPAMVKPAAPAAGVEAEGGGADG